MSERTLQALRGRINARLQTSAISRDRASAAGREVVALCRQSDVETLEWVLSEIDALLCTPRGERPVVHIPDDAEYRDDGSVHWRVRLPAGAASGEGEAMDADEMWNHWTSGHDDAALQGLRTATDDEAHRFLGMVADWQRCPKPSDHDAIAALRPEAQGEVWREVDDLLARLERFEYDAAGESEEYWRVVTIRDRIAAEVER